MEGAAINLGPAPHEYDDVLVNQKEKVSSDDPLKIVLVEVNNLHPDFIDLCSRLSIMAGIKRLLIVGAQRFRDKVDGLLNSTPAGEEPDVLALQIYTQQLTPAYELLLLALEKYCHSCEEPFESRAATQQISMQLRHNSSAWTSSIESGEIGARARKILSDVNTSGKAFDMRQLSASIKPVRWLLQYVNRLVDRVWTDLGVDMRRGEWRNYMDDVCMTMKSCGTAALALCEDFRRVYYPPVSGVLSIR
ncbi:hypothetical protein BJ165DRAFT_376569 [Panaeolus papilionaceus]|nr:hypothetical protein BJ165DRAFT_376569 [Panaeolus papilionaceus]